MNKSASKLSPVILTSYLLVFVSYMTLTVSLPLVGRHWQNFPATQANFQFGLSALFFLFSFSAITLSRAADMIGPYRVLSFAQPVSILGLIITASSINSWMIVTGLCLIGFGTGCYSSVARMLVSVSSPDHGSLRKNFAVFSSLSIFAPLVSSYLTTFSVFLSWRLAYVIMALIEIGLLLKVQQVLGRRHEVRGSLHPMQALKGYLYCLKKLNYVFNLLIIGTGMTLVISVFLGASHQLMIDHFGLSYALFSILNVVISLSYVLGILCVRLLPENFCFIKFRVLLSVILVLAFVCFYLFSTWLPVMLSIFVATFCLGGVVPIATSSGVAVIKKHHGAAAALFVFSFALISSIWSTLKNFLHLSVLSYAVSVFLVTAVLVFVLSLQAYIFKPDNQH